MKKINFNLDCEIEGVITQKRTNVELEEDCIDLLCRLEGLSYTCSNSFGITPNPREKRELRELIEQIVNNEENKSKRPKQIIESYVYYHALLRVSDYFYYKFNKFSFLEDNFTIEEIEKYLKDLKSE